MPVPLSASHFARLPILVATVPSLTGSVFVSGAGLNQNWLASVMIDPCSARWTPSCSNPAAGAIRCKCSHLTRLSAAKAR
jgi:hypothetical protein